MRKFYVIQYEVVGSRKIDEVSIWSDSFINAIKDFTNVEFTVNGFKIKYTEYAIKNIKC